jgi:D-sedoheptulose 7-phosphate isomerase
MIPSAFLKSKIFELRDLLDAFGEINFEEFDFAVKMLSKTFMNKGTIYWCGNGGSAAESSHLATELIGRFKKNREPFSSLSLNADTSVITCIANDFGYEEVFSRQLQGLARSGDVLIVLSTSGNSLNIIRALEMAKKLNVGTIALLGGKGGTAKQLADHAVVINSEVTARIQEFHLLIGHTFCEMLENILLSNRS